MSAFKLVLWGFLAALGAVALAFLSGLVNPCEKVNGLWLVVAAGCMHVLAYRFYGRWISRRVAELNDQRVESCHVSIPLLYGLLLFTVGLLC
jgi:carbon starvation protein